MQIESIRDTMFPPYGRIALKGDGEGCVSVKMPNKTNLVSGVPLVNSGGVGMYAPILNVNNSNNIPVAIGRIQNNINLSLDWLATAITGWYQFHRDRTCSEIIPFIMFDTPTITDEKIYWTMEA